MPTVTGHHTSTLTVGQLVQQLGQVLRSPSSGTALLKDPAGKVIGRLRFHEGKLWWAIAGQHRWRRWQRLIKQYAPSLDPSDFSALQLPPSNGEDYSEEFEALVLLVQQQKLSAEVAAVILQQTILEALFDLLQQATQIASVGILKASEALATSPTFAQREALLQEGRSLLDQSQQAWQEWSAAGLESYSPDLTPVVRNATALQQRTSPQTYQTLSSLLNGQATLRELAVFMKQDLRMLTKTLVAYTQWDLIGLNVIPDTAAILQSISQLSEPVQGQTTEMAAPGSVEGGDAPAQGNVAMVGRGSGNNEQAPLVLCVDDNPKVCEMLGKILVTAGYRYTSVQDSLQALPVLLEQKPDFIFLDLVMPVASGYEVCSQIRRISAFKDTPIVILTGNDGIIDRIRSKASGSTDFISKPLDVQKVLGTLRQYLPDRVPAAAR